MLSGIKNKLGLADDSSRNADAYYDDYEEDMSEPVEESAYAGDYAYDNSPSVSTRPGRQGSSSRYDSTRPHLVSFNDVRANTQIPDSLNRDPLPPRRTSSAYPGPTSRAMTDYSAYAPTASAAPAPVTASRERSTGYESLFAPTAVSSSPQQPSLSVQTTATTGFDPYQAYEGSGIPVYNPQRAMTVIKPASYDEVETVAKSLKAGDVVVLQLRNTPSQLSKRILDFAFGVSSALDASVDCVADKVFVITRVKELTADERTKLRNQGVF